MRTLTLKNVPPELYDRLRSCAEANRRSINNEAIARLQRSLDVQRPSPEATLARLEVLNREIRLPPLTDELMRGARAHDRR